MIQLNRFHGTKRERMTKFRGIFCSSMEYEIWIQNPFFRERELSLLFIALYSTPLIPLLHLLYMKNRKSSMKNE